MITVENAAEFTKNLIQGYYQLQTEPLLRILSEDCIWQTPGNQLLIGAAAIRTAPKNNCTMSVGIMSESVFYHLGGRNEEQFVIVGSYDLCSGKNKGQGPGVRQRATFCYRRELGEYRLYHIHISNEWKEQEQKRIVTIVANSATHFINADAVLYIETANKCSILHMQKQCVTLAIPMRALESKFTCGFCRIHRCYFVNCNYIVSIEHFSVTLLTGEVLPIPEKRYTQVRQAVIFTKSQL